MTLLASVTGHFVSAFLLRRKARALIPIFSLLCSFLDSQRNLGTRSSSGRGSSMWRFASKNCCSSQAWHHASMRSAFAWEGWSGFSCLQRVASRRTRAAMAACQIARNARFVSVVAMPQLRVHAGCVCAHCCMWWGACMSFMPGHVRSQWSRVPGGPLHQVHGKERRGAPAFWLSLYSTRTAPRRATRRAAE